MKFNSLILSFLSISWMILLFSLDKISEYRIDTDIATKYSGIIILFFLAIHGLITIIELKYILPKCYQKEDFNDVSNVENVDGEFLATYLGYFFVALGLRSIRVAGFVFLIVLLFVSFTRAQYYNPSFLFLGYHFYKIENKQNIYLFLITKKGIRFKEELNFNNLRRINDYVFFDAGGDDL